MDETCNYSIYDVNGDVYSVKVSKREALILDNDNLKTYRFLNKLKRQGVRPSRLNETDLSFAPVHNSTMLAMVQHCPSPSFDDTRSPSAKRGRLLEADNIDEDHDLNSSFGEINFNELATPLEDERKECAGEAIYNNATLLPKYLEVKEYTVDSDGLLEPLEVQPSCSAREVNVPDYSPACSVRVTNVPDDLEADLLVPFFEAACEAAGLGDVSVKECTPLGNSSLALVFSSSEMARKAAMLDGLDYLGTALKITVEKQEHLVKVHNVPTGKEAIVLKYVKAALRRQGLLSDEQQPENVSHEDGSLLLKFQDSSSARKLLTIGTLTFLNVPLTFSDYVNTKEAEDSNTTFISEIINVDTLSGAKVDTKMKPASHLLKDVEGKELFLKKLLSTRSFFRNTRNYSAGFARLVGELRSENVDVDLKEVHIRRKYWLDIHNSVKRGTATSSFKNVLRVIFEDENVDILRGTEFEVGATGDEPPVLEPGKIAATAALFSKGACFTDNGAKYLLKVVRLNFEDFLGSKNHDYFWREVAVIMNKEGHYCDGDACERKFLSAKKLYRNFAPTMLKTGSIGPDVDVNEDRWFWNEDMHFMMQKDDIVHPPLTINAGSSKATVTRADCSLPQATASLQTPVAAPTIPRSRVPQLKRPKSKKAVKAEFMMELVKAMNRRTDVLENKKKVSTAEVEDEEEEGRRSYVE